MDYGRLEVDGTPPDGRERWGRHDLQHGVTDLTGHRRAGFLGQGLGFRAAGRRCGHDLQHGLTDLSGHRRAGVQYQRLGCCH